MILAIDIYILSDNGDFCHKKANKGLLARVQKIKEPP